jgi:hypothetical protein
LIKKIDPAVLGQEEIKRMEELGFIHRIECPNGNSSTWYSCFAFCNENYRYNHDWVITTSALYNIYFRNEQHAIMAKLSS